MLGSLSTSHPLSLHFRRWPHKKSDKFLHHSGNFSGWSSSEDFVLIQEMNLVFYICQFNVHETPKFETLLILRELPALGQKDFCNAGSNDDEITSRGSTPCCWEKRDCQEWISQSNNSSFQPLSSVKQGFKLWFNFWPISLEICQSLRISPDTVLWTNNMELPTYWEAWKRIEMATGHVTPLKLSRSSQRPPWAAIKSGYISCLSNLDPVT